MLESNKEGDTVLFTLILVALIVSLIVVAIALRIYTNGLVKELAIMESRIDQKISLIANKSGK
nr:hypothetical protein [Lacticaseibacillus paracasei]